MSLSVERIRDRAASLGLAVPAVRSVLEDGPRTIEEARTSHYELPAFDYNLGMNGRSIRAVVAGVLFIIVVTTLVDFALHVAGVYPPMSQPLDDRLALLATSYRVVISVAGAWLTAWLAPASPMKHALILGVVGTVLGLAGVVATWNFGMSPHWYPIALVVLAVPQCWVGGKIFVARSGGRSGP